MPKTNFSARAALGFAALFFSFSLFGRAQPATVDQEARWLQALQSETTPMEKDAACAKLKLIATARAVPALSALLIDAQLSDSARYVIEAIAAPEAGQALVEALGATTGALKAGIANSLGARRETRAVPALAAALRDPDTAVAIASATALGEIASTEALAALEAAGPASPEPVRLAIVDARLRCAQRFLAAGRQPQALAIFQQLHSSAPNEAVRMAAFRGRVLASGADAVALTCKTITGQSGPDRTVALQLVHELDAPGATMALAKLLPRIDPALQAALIDGLTQRNDPVAVHAISALVSSPAPDVRIAALKALGQLGDDTSVALLVSTASTTTGAEQTAARESLLTLRRGQPAAALLALLPGSKPAAQGEIARALAGRRERSAVPNLLSTAQQGSESAAKAAVLALARLADFEPTAFAALVQLVVGAHNEASRSAAAAGLISACQHIRFRHGHMDATPLVQALTDSRVEMRVALLPACAQLSEPAIRTALRAALADPSPQVRTAATDALCASFDPELLPDLAALTHAVPSAEVRSSAIAACVRLSSDEAAKFSDVRRVGVLQDVLSVASEPDQQRRVLSALADIATPESLRLVAPLLAEPTVRDDAAQAILKIAPLLDDAAPGVAALQQAAASVATGPVQQAIALALRQSRSGYGFITAWQVSGPYRQDGRDYADLFDFVFRPETADVQGANWESRYNLGDGAKQVGNTQGIKWKPVPAAGDNPAAWRVDLGKTIGPQECVAFAQTWLHCDRAQPVQLELGSDCLFKLWLNGNLLYTNPTLRVLRPGSDVLTATLQPGWNRVLLKLAQRDQSANFCLRVLQPDGSPVENLRLSSDGSEKN